jgi:hypothetical protein
MDVDRLENCRMNDEGDFVCEDVSISASHVNEELTIDSMALEQELGNNSSQRSGKVV